MTDEEMVRLLAEKVMRWLAAPVQDLPNVPLRDLLGRHAHAPEVSTFRLGRDLGYCGKGEVVWPWEPLRLIAHAWEVRNKLAESGRVMVDTLEPGTRCGFWLKATSSPQGAYYFEARHESAPRAICFAALRAVGIDPEGEA